MRKLRRLHKWMGVLIGLQVLVWIVSGLLISFIDAESVAGMPTRAPLASPALSGAGKLLSPGELPTTATGLESLTLLTVDGEPAYRVTFPGHIELLSARSGQRIPIDQARAMRIARASYSGDGGAVDASRVIDPVELTRFEGPAWIVEFDDAQGTRAYIDARDGRLLAHRNNRSALVELLLKLHFMDYNGGNDFNHPLIIAAALLVLLLAVSGTILLVISLRRVGLR